MRGVSVSICDIEASLAFSERLRGNRSFVLLLGRCCLPFLLGRDARAWHIFFFFVYLAFLTLVSGYVEFERQCWGGNRVGRGTLLRFRTPHCISPPGSLHRTFLLICSHWLDSRLRF